MIAEENRKQKFTNERNKDKKIQKIKEEKPEVPKEPELQKKEDEAGKKVKILKDVSFNVRPYLKTFSNLRFHILATLPHAFKLQY